MIRGQKLDDGTVSESAVFAPKSPDLGDAYILSQKRLSGDRPQRHDDARGNEAYLLVQIRAASGHLFRSRRTVVAPRLRIGGIDHGMTLDYIGDEYRLPRQADCLQNPIQ